MRLVNEDAKAIGRRATVIATAGFICHFFIMTAYYVLKPMRSSVFLSTWGKEYFAYFLIANAVASFVASIVFSRLADTTTKRMFITGIQGFFIATIIGFWVYFYFTPIKGVISAPTLMLSAGFILFVNCFVLFTVTPFWSLVNDLFAPEQGKKLFGFIGAGGTLGALCGSQLTNGLAKRLGTMNLLPVSAGILALTIPLFLYLMRMGGIAEREEEERAKRAKEKSKKKPSGGALQGLKIVIERSYVAKIATVVVLSTFCMTVIDYQLHVAVADELTKLDQQTAFFANAHKWIQLVSIPVHLVLTPLLLSYLGVGAALSLLPLGLIVGSVCILTKASLNTLFFVFIATFALHYSVNQVSKELLYVPCGDDVKYKAKAFIDIFGYRLGPVLCAAVQLVGGLFGVGLAAYSAVVVGSSMVWLPLIVTIHKSFKEATSGDDTKNPAQAK